MLSGISHCLGCCRSTIVAIIAAWTCLHNADLFSCATRFDDGIWISDGITPQIVVSSQLIQHLVIVVVALNQKGLGWKLSIVAGMIGMASQA